MTDETTAPAVSEGRAEELLYRAWVVIANAGGGDWSSQPAQWRAAAEQWRDDWHAAQPDAGTRPGRRWGPATHELMNAAAAFMEEQDLVGRASIDFDGRVDARTIVAIRAQRPAGDALPDDGGLAAWFAERLDEEPVGDAAADGSLRLVERYRQARRAFTANPYADRGEVDALRYAVRCAAARYAVCGGYQEAWRP